MWKTFSMGSCPVVLKNQTPWRESARFGIGFDDVCFIGAQTQRPMRKNREDNPKCCGRLRPRGTGLAKAALALIACYFLSQPLAQAQIKEVRRILVFNELELGSPGIAAIDNALVAALENSPYQIEFYSESLDTPLFPDQASQRQFREWFLLKYRERKPDVIVALGPSSIRFMVESHEKFFPNTPIVIGGTPEALSVNWKFDSHFTGAWAAAHPGETLEVALQLQPSTKHVVVVGGVAPYDRYLESLVKERFRHYESQFDFTYLTDLDMPALLERLKHLPTHTIVYHTSIMLDAAGNHFIDATQSVPLVAGASVAPVFTVDDVDVGRGTVGGDVFSFAAHGREVGGIIVRILNGEKPQDIPIARGGNVFLFDRRALRRFGLKESSLPPGSILLNRDLNFWEQYKRYVIAGILLLTAQVLIIFGLLWQKVKRKRVEAALASSNERLRMAMESGKSVGWDWDIRTGRDLWFGDLRTMFGISSDTFTGEASDFYRYVHPEDRQRVSEAVADARRNRKPYAEEFRVVRQDGMERWVAARGEFKYTKNGDASQMVGLAVDITERKQIEDALKSSERKFSKIFRESPLSLTLTNANDHRYIDINDAFYHMTGWNSEEVIGRTPFDIGLWVDPDQRIQLAKRLLATGSWRGMEFPFRTKDGEIRVGMGSAELIDVSGEPCILSVVADITEVKRAEEARQVSERRFSQFFETLPEYCYMTSPTGEILDANPVACEALGYTKEELIGKPLSAFYAPESLPKLVDLLEKWNKAGSLHNEEMVILTREGKRRSVLLNAGSVKDAKGNISYSASVQVDITDRKQIQKKLRESQNRLEGIVASAMDAIIAVDQDQRIIVFNAAAEKMFACPAHQAIGTIIDRFIPQLFRIAHSEHIRRFGELGITTQSMGTLDALWGVRTTGKEFPIEASISHTEDSGKKLSTVIIRDVTERHQAEEALKRSEERSKEQVLHSPVAMVVTRGGMNEIEVMSLKFTQLFGYTIDDVPDEAHWWHLAYPDEPYREAIKAEWQRRVEKAVKSNIVIEPMEATVRCKDGSTRHIEFHFASLGESGLVSFVDLTERRVAEEALRESEERFRLVANAAPVLIWMSGSDKLCTYFNQPWLRFTGRSIHEELGNRWTEGVHPEDLEPCLDTYTKAFDRREPFEIVYRLRRHDGEYRWILNLGVPRFNRDGSFAGYIGSCLDVTERKLAEEALSTVSRRLIEAHEEERTWIARELHDDINQRLALLSVNMGRLEQDLPESADGLRNRLQEEMKYLSDIASEIQTLSHRLHSSKLEYLGLAAAAASFCREFSDQQKVEIDFHSDDVTRELPQEISLCLFRVLQEALQNAAKHSGSKRFQVMLRCALNEIHLTVRDSGIGFDLEQALRGHGLGLTSMKERLKLVHGQLSIDPQPGLGTIIRVTVPVSSSSNAAQA